MQAHGDFDATNRLLVFFELVTLVVIVPVTLAVRHLIAGNAAANLVRRVLDERYARSAGTSRSRGATPPGVKIQAIRRPSRRRSDRAA